MSNLLQFVRTFATAVGKSSSSTTNGVAAAAAAVTQYLPADVRKETRLADPPISYTLIDFITENRKRTRQQIYEELCDPSTSSWTRSEIHRVLQRLTKDGLLDTRLSSIRGHGAYYVPTKDGIKYMIEVEEKGAKLRKQYGRPDPE